MWDYFTQAQGLGSVPEQRRRGRRSVEFCDLAKIETLSFTLHSTPAETAVQIISRRFITSLFSCCALGAGTHTAYKTRRVGIGQIPPRAKRAFPLTASGQF